MKSLYKVRIEDSIKSLSVDDKETNESVTMITETGKIIKLQSDHSQDCCEHVFADFSILEKVKDEIINRGVSYIEMLEVKMIGFLLCFDDRRYLIPCRNEQNGYYSSQLDVLFRIDNNATTVNLNDCVPDSDE